MSNSKLQDIQVTVDTTYIASSSEPEAARYVFAYSITIKNTGNIEAQLLSRHWVITDANGKVQEVQGEGVIGEQPHIPPGESFQYTSGAVIETSVGAMQGSYHMLDSNGEKFTTTIPQFSLSIPRTLH
ncbi:MAG: Co2+/Mg2+ efflux protein ApaG [Cycloclasticus sp. symbiont of Bathymodiolus heckerae]|nr:MAG: Co2+/Mg2+ efflux protein ApaG [Cycloclasticus sp. symbiont of Bathymodiolus heckerae]